MRHRRLLVNRLANQSKVLDTAKRVIHHRLMLLCSSSSSSSLFDISSDRWLYVSCTISIGFYFVLSFVLSVASILLVYGHGVGLLGMVLSGLRARRNCCTVGHAIWTTWRFSWVTVAWNSVPLHVQILKLSMDQVQLLLVVYVLLLLHLLLKDLFLLLDFLGTSARGLSLLRLV